MAYTNFIRDRDRDRDRERKRRRSRSRDKDRERSERKREKRERERDRRERDRDRGDRLEYIKTDDGGEIRIKEEPIDGEISRDYDSKSKIYLPAFLIRCIFLDYPDYSHYDSQSFDQAQVKYEDEEEQKYQIPDNSNGGQNSYDDYEEGEAY